MKRTQMTRIRILSESSVFFWVFFRIKKLAWGKLTFDYQQPAHCRPKNNPAFAYDCNRHRNPGRKRKCFSNKSGAGFVNADDERYQLEDHCDQPADRFKKVGVNRLGTLSISRLRIYQTSPMPIIKYADSSKADRQKAFRMMAVKAVDEVFEAANVMSAIF